MSAAFDLPNRPLTLDDVTRIAEDNIGRRFELSEGNLIVMPPGTWRHYKIGVRMSTWLMNHGYEDRVNVGPGVRTATDNLSGRIPDLMVTREPISDETETIWFDPESIVLAVEIVSKGSERTDRWLKPIEYAEARIPLFWRVEPDNEVQQFRLDGATYVEHAKIPLDELLAGDVPDLT